jgi:hypothetical protein
MVLSFLSPFVKKALQKMGIRPPERPAGSAARVGEYGSTSESWCRIARARRTAHSAWNPVRASRCPALRAEAGP